MSSLKHVIKRGPATSNHATLANLQPILSQRGKANSSQHVLKKNNHIEAKHSTIDNKYRIVTEPIDDRMLQLSHSYAKLSRSKKKQVKEIRFQSQHNSIKSRQKTHSNEKHVIQISCPNCTNYERQLAQLKQSFRTAVDLKNRWKNGVTTLDDFARQGQTHRSLLSYQTQKIAQEMQLAMLDLMQDIEILTQIDYPSLISHNMFNTDETMLPSEEEEEIKLLLHQLRCQAEGQTTLWDAEDYNGNDNFRSIIRNLKINVAHCLRDNIALRTQLSLRKDYVQEDQIKRAVCEVMRGLRK